MKNIFISYFNDVKRRGLSNCKDLGVTKLIYKKTGESYLVTNYRPIPLINSDVKIIKGPDRETPHYHSLHPNCSIWPQN